MTLFPLTYRVFTCPHYLSPGTSLHPDYSVFTGEGKEAVVDGTGSVRGSTGAHRTEADDPITILLYTLILLLSESLERYKT